MDMGTMGAIIGSVWGIAVGGANIFKTLYGKKFCDKHNGLISDVLGIKISTHDIVRLAEALEKLESRMGDNEGIEKDFHTQIKEVININSSWFYDIKLVLDVLTESLIDDELNKRTITKILGRKTKGPDDSFTKT